MRAAACPADITVANSYRQTVNPYGFPISELHFEYSCPRVKADERSATRSARCNSYDIAIYQPWALKMYHAQAHLVIMCSVGTQLTCCMQKKKSDCYLSAECRARGNRKRIQRKWFILVSELPAYYIVTSGY